MHRRSTRVAWALLALWVVSVAALVTLSVANGSFQHDPLANTVGCCWPSPSSWGWAP